MKKYIRIIIILIFATIFCVSAFMIAKELLELKKDADTFDALAKEIEISSDDGEENEVSDQAETSKGKKKKKRNINSLCKKNDECIGWVCIPKTHIDYPVMHTPNYPEKYLHRNFYGEYSVSGTPFMDERCDLDSINRIFYGHNMRNDTMFSDLLGYMDKAYYEKHPVIEYETTEGCFEYEVFAVLQIKSYDVWYDFIEAYDEEEYNLAIADILERAEYDTGIVPEYGDRLLTLSTCYISNSDERLVVVGVDRVE